jgi:oligopeptide transport system substrate-binding protein
MPHRSLTRALTACAFAACLLLARPGWAQPRVAQLPIRTDGPKSLDPAKGSTTYDNQACSQIFDCLFQYKYLKRPLELEGSLAEEVPEPINNADGTQTWRIRLRKGVVFHDDDCFPGGKGREVVADDVFYSWRRLADPKYEYENWWLIEGTILGLDEYKDAQKAAVDAGKPFDYEAPVAGFKKLSDREFEIILSKPVIRFKWVVAMFQLSVVPREAVEKYGERFTVHPVGTGPFMVREGDWKPGEKLIFLRNPRYREEYYPSECTDDDRAVGLDAPAGKRLPFLDRIEVQFYVQDQPMWLDFRAKKIGFVQVPAEYFEQAYIKRSRRLRPAFAREGIRSHPEPLLDFIFRGFNMEDPLVGGYTEQKKALRQAINLAVDLNEFNEKFYNGINIEYDGPIPPVLDGFPRAEAGRKEGEARLSYRGPDLPLARELLAKAGYPEGKGLPAIDYYTSKGGNEAEQTQMLVRQLERIGVRLNPRLVDFSELIELIGKKKAQFFGFAWGSDYPDAENNLALFYSKNKAPGANHYNYDRPEFDRMYEQILVMAPGPERTAILVAMRDMIIEDAPYVGSQARTRFYLINPWLKNFKPSEDFYNFYKYMDVER